MTYQELRERTLEALNNKHGSVCRSCGHNDLTLEQGFVTQPITQELGSSLMLGGPVIPSVAINCTRCGYMHFYTVKFLLPDLEIWKDS